MTLEYKNAVSPLFIDLQRNGHGLDERIRTAGLQLRRLPLYPTELRRDM